MNDNNIINGWEYLTPIKPTEEVLEQKLQTDYLVQYNLAYKTFIESICINSENLEKIVNEIKYIIDPKTKNPSSKYRFMIETYEDDDIINKNDDYAVKFTKSKFILYKYKKVKADLINYYKPLGYYVKGPFKIVINNNINKYFIELYWNNH
jgi:hypothetical protein